MHTVVLVLIEVLIVIGLSRLVGLAFRWINQPLVIGEIVAGIMLGPSPLYLVWLLQGYQLPCSLLKQFLF